MWQEPKSVSRYDGAGDGTWKTEWKPMETHAKNVQMVQMMMMGMNEAG
jgi:hypothetical protein